MKRISAPLTLMIPAPPKPCSTRPATSCGSVVATAHPTEAKM